jgi:hypothetical protein
MSLPSPPLPAKLVIGMFMKDKKLSLPVAEKLEEQYGEIDIVSRWLPFDLTTYYEAEMGTGLYRRMFSFKKPIAQDALPDVKHAAYDLEDAHAINGKRQINIDPGYLLPERFVLATGKNFSHRVYIGRNIYADLTLVYLRGAYRTLPWTYPDYAREDMVAFLDLVRKRHLFDRNRNASHTGPIT